MRNILTILRKEFRSSFDHPTAYIVLGVFLLLWEFLFFQRVFLVGEASLRLLFDVLPWLLIFVVPGLTMGSIAQEKADGTLELLLTHPLKDRELILGKFLASLAFLALAFLFMIPIGLSLASFGSVDWGVVAGQYLGSLCLAAVLVALGVFISSLLSSPVASLLVSAAAGFLLVIAGSEIVTAGLPAVLGHILEQLSVTSHFQSMARGVIDLRDVWYVLCAVTVFLSLAYLQLRKRKFGNNRSVYRKYQLKISAFVCLAVIVAILGNYVPIRIDLTQSRLYTITATTKKILGNLTGPVTLTLYASDQLPAQLQPVLRDIADTLRDYASYGGGNIIVIRKNPAKDQSVAQEAVMQGVEQAQFNVVGQGNFQVQTGFLGITAAYGDQSEVIPFVQSTADLEYQLTSIIRKLTVTEKKTVRFLTGHGEKTPQEYGALHAELGKQYVVQPLTIDSKNPAVPDETAALVIAGPTTEINAKTRTAVKTYLDGGGSAFFLIDTLSVDLSTLSGTGSSHSFADFLLDYGVSVHTDAVYDVRSNETVNFSGGGGANRFMSFLLPYPFWALVQPFSSSSPVTSRIGSVMLPWTGTISLDDETLTSAGLRATNLLMTTRFAGRMTGAFNLAPQQDFPAVGLTSLLVAVSLSGDASDDMSSAALSGTRMVVVGNSNFLTDQFMQQSPENLAFGMGAVSWLAHDDSIASIQLKQNVERKLVFGNDTQIALVKFGNMVFALIVLLGIGLYRFLRRRHLRQLTYGSIV
ncbi:MAG: Gldg family protein [Candidatus Peribacteraceae bacterium]|nr:Gldg family protein [Candidatus Peribacteraceae bacterium]